MSSTPLLTIGMACYRDFNGVYFTLQSLRLYHPEVMDRVELLVIDNDPNSADSSAVRDFMVWIRGRSAHSQYIPYEEVTGTAAPRNQVFARASGKYVLCLDSHVLLAPGSLARLLDYYEQHPETSDLLSGPILYDDLVGYATHFSDVWSSEMWGQWGTDERGLSPDAPPFEIPAMGLGVFSCRKKAWLGFNPSFRGFGGEEWYIHEKYRRAGHKCLCLPFLRWVHRFGRPAGVPYPLTRRDKVRNYILGHQELGMPLDRVYKHFVHEQKMPQAEWDAILADVSGQPAPATTSGGCGCSKQKDNAALPETLAPQEWFTNLSKLPGGIGETVTYVQSIAVNKQRVVELGRGTHLNAITVAAIAGSPEEFVLHGDGPTPREFAKFAQGSVKVSHVPVPVFQATDLLIVNNTLSANDLYATLRNWEPHARRIAVVGTSLSGEEAPQKAGPGLLPGLRRFLKEHSDWVVVKHHVPAPGVTLISSDDKDKKPLPSMTQMAWNYAKAKTAHLLSGGHFVDEETYDKRLELCTLCEHRNDNRCSLCGCFLAGDNAKAALASSFCPIGKW